MTFGRGAPIMDIMAKRTPPPLGTKLVQFNAPEAMVRRFRVATVERGTTMTAVFIEAMTRFLGESPTPPKATKPRGSPRPPKSK